MNLSRRPLLLAFFAGLGLQLVATICRSASNYALFSQSTTSILSSSSSNLATIIFITNCFGWILTLFADLLTGSLYSYFFYQNELPEGQEHLTGGAITAAISHFLFAIISQTFFALFTAQTFADSGIDQGLYSITYILSSMVSLCLSLAMGGMLGAAGASLAAGWLEIQLRTSRE